MHSYGKLEVCQKCGIFHNKIMTLTEGYHSWLLTFENTYVRSFDTLQQFKEWLKKENNWRDRDNGFDDYTQIIIVASVKSIRDW